MLQRTVSQTPSTNRNGGSATMAGLGSLPSVRRLVKGAAAGEGADRSATTMASDRLSSKGREKSKKQVPAPPPDDVRCVE